MQMIGTAPIGIRLAKIEHGPSAQGDKHEIQLLPQLRNKKTFFLYAMSKMREQAMTRNEILEVAGKFYKPETITEREIAFARYMMGYEREACAKVCEDLVPTYLKDGERWLKGKNGNPDKRLKDIAPNLEAAWEAEQLLKNDVITFITEAHLCANAIRNRGDL